MKSFIIRKASSKSSTNALNALGIGTGKLGTKCGTCEPLQSPTDAALERMICRAMEGTPK